MVYRIAYGLTQSEADAEDVLQDVFAGLPEALRSFEGRSRLRDWLKTVATRRSLMLLRQKRLRREVMLDGSGAEPTERAEPVIDRIALQRALAELPDALRVVFILKEVEGYSHEEIGRLIGTGAGGSASRLHRARNMLRDRLKGSA